MIDVDVKNRVADATGELVDILRAETGASVDRGVIQTPTYSSIRQHLNGGENGSVFKAATKEKLRLLAGARAIIGYAVKERLHYSPGIVLVDGRLGVLHNIHDTKESTGAFKDGLTDMQQLLLAGVYVRQQESVGVSHQRGVAELGHATLIAVSSDPSTIHDTTHKFAESKKFGVEVASLTSVYRRHQVRPTDTILLDPQNATGVFLPDHQSPLPASGFEASAGFALAATKTQDRIFDLKANAGAMAAQMGV